jgi:hypothetical protein
MKKRVKLALLGAVALLSLIFLSAGCAKTGNEEFLTGEWHSDIIEAEDEKGLFALDIDFDEGGKMLAQVCIIEVKEGVKTPTELMETKNPKLENSKIVIPILEYNSETKKDEVVGEIRLEIKDEQLIGVFKGETQNVLDLTFSKTDYIFFDKEKGTFLKCISQGDSAAVDSFLTAGFNPNFIYFSEVPLIEAARGHKAVVKLLLENGADVNLGTEDDCPLKNAVLWNGGYIDIVKMLLDRGANVNWGTEYSCVLEAAVFGKDIDIIKILLENGAELNPYIYSTPLGASVFIENAEIVKLLLDIGADPNFKGRGYQTPLEQAKETGNVEIISLLRNAGAKK